MAKPIQGTKQADLHLMGTAGDDSIQGKDGNDFITGGHGNDNIDGGDGIDTAVYSGNIADYSIDIKGTGNDKVTVSDHVNGRDGVDQLKHIELLQFSDGVVDLQHGTSWHYLVDAEIDVAARKPGTHEMINGSGIEGRISGWRGMKALASSLPSASTIAATPWTLLPTVQGMHPRTRTGMPMVCSRTKSNMDPTPLGETRQSGVGILRSPPA
jgi:hypothetical protein